MIDPNPTEGGATTQSGDVALFTIPSKLTWRPVANHLILDFQKPEKVGAIHLPGQMKPLETIVATVLAVGPDVKQIKVGERVLILTKALIGGVDGLLVEGRRVYLTQEQVVIAVVDSPASTPE